jgi:hypothetical protein
MFWFHRGPLIFSGSCNTFNNLVLDADLWILDAVAGFCIIRLHCLDSTSAADDQWSSGYGTEYTLPHSSHDVILATPERVWYLNIDPTPRV